MKWAVKVDTIVVTSLLSLYQHLLLSREGAREESYLSRRSNSTHDLWKTKLEYYELDD